MSTPASQLNIFNPTSAEDFYLLIEESFLQILAWLKHGSLKIDAMIGQQSLIYMIVDRKSNFSDIMGKIILIEWMLRTKPELIKTRNRSGNSLLHVTKEPYVAELLLRHGLDPNSTNLAGETAATLIGAFFDINTPPPSLYDHVPHFIEWWQTEKSSPTQSLINYLTDITWEKIDLKHLNKLLWAGADIRMLIDTQFFLLLRSLIETRHDTDSNRNKMVLCRVLNRSLWFFQPMVSSDTHAQISKLYSLSDLNKNQIELIKDKLSDLPKPSLAAPLLSTLTFLESQSNTYLAAMVLHWIIQGTLATKRSDLSVIMKIAAIRDHAELLSVICTALNCSDDAIREWGTKKIYELVDLPDCGVKCRLLLKQFLPSSSSTELQEKQKFDQSITSGSTTTASSSATSSSSSETDKVKIATSMTLGCISSVGTNSETTLLNPQTSSVEGDQIVPLTPSC